MRGKYKHPGVIRTSQNWIGGASINDAVFIPPHHDHLPLLMKDLEKFLNNETILAPELIRIAIAHYQFETIHPFLDGNGRVGRLLITLYLVSKGILLKPTLYLSSFFEANKSLYYDNLMRVRTHNDLTQWVKFFLEGVRETSENSIQTFCLILELRKQCDEKVKTLGRKIKTGTVLLDFLYSTPIIDSQLISEVLNVDRATSIRLIDDFVRLDILKETTGQKRNRLFSFSDYIKLFN